MIPARVALALQADGWWLRSDIIWHKPNPMPESVTDRPASAHEHVFLLTKAATYYYDHEAIKEEASDNPISAARRCRADGGAVGTKAIFGSGFGQSGVGHNASYRGGTRNAQNVWTITTKPFSGAHFATFPPDLAERCIKAGTSEIGCCPHCGNQWERVIIKGEPDEARQAACGADASGGYRGQSTKDHDKAGVQNASDVKRRILEGMRKKTYDWQAGCDCRDNIPVPATVLDPFSGAGTTSLVADRLGRNGVGIELNPEYAAMATDRVKADAGLFAEVAE